MNTPDPTSLRRAGLASTLGGLLTLVAGVVVQGVVVPASEVSREMWSYPWSSSALVPVSLGYAVFHLLVLLGVLGVGRSGAAGDGRGARVGTALAAAGTAILTVAELLSIPVADQRTDDTGAGLVGATFGLGTVVSAVGFLVLGVAAIRAARWDGWRRYTPLAVGIWLVALTILVATPALAIAVGVYGLLLTAMGLALATDPVPAAHPAETQVRV